MRGCSTRLGRYRRAAFRAGVGGERCGRWERTKRETHDGVCRVRGKLGETARVEDVGGENIAEGRESLRVGVVGHGGGGGSCGWWW